MPKPLRSAPLLPDTTTTRNEWRVGGSDPRRGSWEGGWYPGDGPSEREMWDIRQLAKRNAAVWIDRRTLTISHPHPREEVIP